MSKSKRYCRKRGYRKGILDNWYAGDCIFDVDLSRFVDSNGLVLDDHYKIPPEKLPLDILNVQIIELDEQINFLNELNEFHDNELFIYIDTNVCTSVL